MKQDRLARRLAASAFAMALVAMVLGVYAVSLGQQYLEDVRTLGQALERQQETTGSGLGGPPLTLETD